MTADETPSDASDEQIFDFVLDGIPITVTGTLGVAGDDADGFVWFHVPASDAADMVPPETLEQLIAKFGGCTAEHICIGGFVADNVLTLQGDKHLFECVSAASLAFRRTAKQIGKWKSFASMLEARFEYVPGTMPPQAQPRVAWSWVTAAPLGHPRVMKVRAYQDRGVFVDEHGRLQVFSGWLPYAKAMTSSEKTADLSTELTQVPCLGCFLNGVTGDAGRERIRGAILDGQWPLMFHTCSEHGDRCASHFTLNDGGHLYHLIGCADAGDGPLWADDRWANNGFNLSCKLDQW